MNARFLVGYRHSRGAQGCPGKVEEYLLPPDFGLATRFYTLSPRWPCFDWRDGEQVFGDWWTGWHGRSSSR